MSGVLAVTLQAMQADASRVDQIAANLTNSLTPGYKRSVAVQAAGGASFGTHLDDAAAALATQFAAGAGAPTIAFRADARPGTLKSTGQPLDLALGGDGYFEVSTNSGPAYTRQGNFHVDATGRIVTAEGDAVMGQGGEILLPVGQRVVVTSNGAILAGDANDDAPTAQLKIVSFDAGTPPQPLGNGLFAPGEAMTLLRAEQVQVRQGFLENSNVDSAQEMTGLIQTMRHFEALQKIAQGYDDMLGTAIRKLGEGS